MCTRERALYPGISIAVLGGGTSKRFGSDKIRASVRGRPLILHVWEKLAHLTDDIFLQLKPGTKPLGDRRTSYDAVPGKGPLSGLHGALENCVHPELWLVGGDMPGMDPRLLRSLYRHRHHEIAIPVWENGYFEPLGAIYSRSLLPRIADLLEEGKYRIMHVIDASADVHKLPIDKLMARHAIEENCFANINTKADLRDFLEKDGG